MTEQKKALLREMARKYFVDAVLVFNVQWHKENYRFLTGENFVGPLASVLYHALRDEVHILYSSQWDLCYNQPRISGAAMQVLDPGMQALTGLLRDGGVRTAALSGGKYLPASMAAAIAAAGTETVAADGFLERARLIKTPEEIGFLKQAVSLSENAWTVFMQGVAGGLNEYQIAANVEYYLKKNGAEDNFLLMATGGKEVRGMPPPMNRTAKPGDMVRTEITPQVNGWWAQVCRTCVKGKASADQLEAFSVFLESEQAGIDMARPGVNIREVAKAENDVFRKYGYGEYCTERYTRGRGHGHGLDLDEQPLISESSDLVLEAGMVIVIHPNTYHPLSGYMVFGDPVEITENGCRILSTAERKLFEV